MSEKHAVPADLVVAVASERLREPLPLQCLWVAVGEGRDAYSELVHQLADTRPIVALPVRGVAFADPNSLLQDLATLIDRSRSEFENGRGALFRAAGKGLIVLVARRSLDVPMTASPITLPAWFPVHPGETQLLGIEDITLTASAPLSGSTLQLDQLCSLLFELDGLMLRCVAASHQRDHQATNALYDRMRPTGPPPERIEQFLESAQAARAQVRNPSSFRPSSGKGEFLVARLWRLMSETPPNKATAAASALAQALLLEDSAIAGSMESIFAVLNRPTSPDAKGAVRYARNLLHVIRTSCQLTTAAAHSDDYPAISVVLQGCISMDLRSSLNHAIGICERLLRASSG